MALRSLRRRLPAGVLSGALACGCAHDAPRAETAGVAGGVAAPSTAAERTASELLSHLAHQDWDAAVEPFDGQMAQGMPASRLRELWLHLLSTQGGWVGADLFATQVRPPNTIALVDARFARRRQRLRVTVDPQGRVAGLFRGPVPQDAEAEARALVTSLARSAPESANRLFSERLRAALPPKDLAAAWASLIEKDGPFDRIDDARGQEQRGFFIVLVRCRMRLKVGIVRVVFDGDGDVAGLFFLPDDPEVGWSFPDYANPDALTERDVIVASGPGLPGTLTLPRAAVHVPGVVLVHGSGPLDRDETVGGTKVFRDLAVGLGSRGIAVLRYEKRTRVDAHGGGTPKEEVEDGALAAISVLRSVPEVDAARVVLLGHSQGGAFAPRLARRDGRLAGIILLAAPARPVEDTLVAQLKYLVSLQPTEEGRAAVQQALQEAEEFKRLVEDPALRADTEVRVPGGGTVSGAYFLDLRSYDPVQTAASLSCPTLVLQGGRDYQVTEADLDAWRKGLAGSRDVSFHEYPDLDHRFVSGQGPSSPAQYMLPEHVQRQVVDDIAAWVLALGSVTT